MNGHNETNNQIKSTIEQKKRKQNPCMISSIQVRTKMRTEHTYSSCEQKDHKVKNCDRIISIGKEVDPNHLIQFMVNSCPLEENEFGAIIQSDKMIWKNDHNIKFHLIKSEIKCKQ